MAKKSRKNARREQPSNVAVEKDVKVSKQAVGGITGAVLGALVGGPLAAIAGGVAGALVGDQSAKGKRPVARTAETIGEEVRKGTPMKALKSVADATRSLGRSKKKSSKSSKPSPSASGGRKKAKSASKKKTAKKAKSAKKSATTKKRAKKR
jgi:hypothetical protein